jgi:hypothetical protein
MSSDKADAAEIQDYINRKLNLQRIEDNALDRIISAAGTDIPATFDREAFRHALQSVVQWEVMFGRSKPWPRFSVRKQHAKKILNSAIRLRTQLQEEELAWWFMNYNAFPKQEEAQHAFTVGLARVIEAAELMVSASLTVSDDDDIGLGGMSATIAAHIIPIFEEHFKQQATITTDWEGKKRPNGAIIGFVQAVSRELELFPECPEPAASTIATAVKRRRTLQNRECRKKT